MIRTVAIPTRVSRMGLVAYGGGGNASGYQFDPSTGLSNDPRLSSGLQDLTPAQLQTALSGGDPYQGAMSLLQQDITGTGAGALPCGDANGPDPTCSGGNASAGVPVWLWIAGGGLVALLLLRR
jgi:hypothetical protein